MDKDYLKNIGLLFLRVAISILMITHGVPKLEMLLSGNAQQFPDPLGISPVLSLILVTGAEFFCSLILILGFKSRIFALPLIFDMLIAAFVAHSGSGFQDKEPAILYLTVYISIALLGEGKFSLDGFIEKQMEKKEGGNINS
ncbi:MAG: DoxX family protein [Prevotellaceae bacterium]|jgi:putative oxidoreductase|nr:DoxX family protein [Prevotellaceae bacterium]